VKLQSRLKTCEIEKGFTNKELQMAKGLKDAIQKERDHLLEIREKLTRRVDIAEKDLGVCHDHEVKLEQELCQVGEDRDQLSETVRSLKERLASKETLDFLNLVKQMGTGGYASFQSCTWTDFILGILGSALTMFVPGHTATFPLWLCPRMLSSIPSSTSS
jgi:hypothetical protein